MQKDRIELLGCPIDRLTMEETVARCVEWIRRERQPHLLCGANASAITAMQTDTALKHAICGADLVQPDGMAVVWASRLLGMAVPEKVSGVDLMDRLLAAASAHCLRVFFLGAKEQVVRRLVEVSHERYPGALVAGFQNGYFPRHEQPDVVRKIRDSNADMLFVGMPTPFKEVWCHENKEALGVPVILGVGGSFDVHAGFVRRAPRWMQMWGLEWSWRLLMEPRKMWKRYLVSNCKFILMVLGALVGGTGSGKPRRMTGGLQAKPNGRRTHGRR